MTLVFNCRDIGFDCDGVVKAGTEEELLAQVAEHAKSVHGMNEIDEPTIEKVKSLVREE